MEASSSPGGSWSLEPHYERDPSSPGGASRPWSHVPPFTPSASIPARQALSPSWLGSFLHLPQTATSGSPTPTLLACPACSCFQALFPYLITRHVCSVSHSLMVFVE